MEIINPVYDKSIPIVFAADNNFIPYLYVAIQSLVDNSSNENNYDIVILCTDIDEYKQNQFKRLEKENISIRFFEMANLMSEYRDVWYTHWSYTDSVYYRFFIPKLYKEYDKILFLDADIIINCDISELYNMDIGENSIAAAVGLKRLYPSDFHRKFVKEVLGLEYRRYFNAGIFVLDLKKIQKDSYLNDCINLLKELNNPPLQDQDVMNLYFKNKVYYLDCTYNWTWNCIHNVKNFVDNIVEEDIKKEFINASQEPKIIHYAGKYKPWKQPHLAYAEYFWKYARKTPFYEEILYKNISKGLGRQSIYNVVYRKRIYAQYLRCKLLKFITFGKKRQHYASKAQALKNMVKDYRKTLQK